MLHRVIKIIVETSLNHEKKIAKLENKVAILEKQNVFYSELLRNIEEVADSRDGDLQQISVAIKRTRFTVDTEKFLQDDIKPGLVRG